MKFTLSGVLLIVAALSLWLTLGHGEPIPVVIEADEASITKSYLEEAERWTYDVQGQRSQVLTIDSAQQRSGHPATFLSGLTFEGPDDSGRFWRVTAGAGQLKPNQNELHLTKGVEVRESEGNGVLTTPRLRVLMSQERLVNRAPVKLTLKDSVTTARGMDIDMRQSVVKLLSEVETVFYEG